MYKGQKISVALASYNGSRFIIEQLDSIIHQSIAPDEVIICDDCSTDATFEILEKYASDYPIVKVYRNESNLGFIKNFEKAAKLCTGDLILFSDQDDIWTNDHIELLVKNSEDSDLVCANAEYMTEDGTLTGRTMKYRDFKQSGNIRQDFRCMIYTHYAQGAALLIKKETLTKIMPFPKNQFHDIWMGFAVYLVGGKVKYLPDVILHYRRWGSNVSTLNSERTQRMHLLKRLQFLLSDGGVFDKMYLKIKIGVHFVRYNNCTPKEIAFELNKAYHFVYDMTHKKTFAAFKYFVKNHNLIFFTPNKRGIVLRFIRYFILH